MAYTNIPTNLQDMFYNLQDQINKLVTGPNQAMYTAEASSAQAVQAIAYATQAANEAGIAQAQAIQALAQAQSAYALGSQALIKSAQTITNASNQLTAINGNGITVYSGASATSGARVLFNSAGIVGYNSSNVATFTVNSSNGQMSTTGGVFAEGAITGGTLNINGNAIISSQGVLTATGATITGTINATAGYFGTSSNGWSISSTGLTGVGTGNITGGTISGSTINVPAVSPKFSVSSAGAITSTSGTIGGWTLSATRLSSGTSTFMDSSTGNIATIGQITANSAYIDTGGFTSVGVSYVSELHASGLLYNSGYPTTTGTANMRINTTAGASLGLIAYTSSSQRYKVNIEESLIPVQSILQLNPKTYIDKAEYEEKGSADGLQRWLGFIAEEIAEIPVLKDLLVEYNKDGLPTSVFYDRIAAALVPLLKDHEQRLKMLEGK